MRGRFLAARFHGPFQFLWPFLSFLLGSISLFTIFQPAWFIEPDGTEFGLITYCLTEKHHEKLKVRREITSDDVSSLIDSTILFDGRLIDSESHERREKEELKTEKVASNFIRPYPLPMGPAIRLSSSSAKSYGRYCFFHGAQSGPDWSALPSWTWGLSVVSLLIGSIFLILTGLASVPLVSGLSGPRLFCFLHRSQLFAALLLISGTMFLPWNLNSSMLDCGKGSGHFSRGECEFGWSFTLSLTASALSVFPPILAHTLFYVTAGPGGHLAMKKSPHYDRLPIRDSNEISLSPLVSDREYFI